MIHSQDKEILRRLGGRKSEIGVKPVQKATLALWRDMNDLKPGRPMVYINEIPWREIEKVCPEILPRCSDPFLRGIECGLLREIYQWEHFACDMVVEPIVYSPASCGPTSSYANYGIKENAVAAEGADDVVYLPVIDSLADADLIRRPDVWSDKPQTDRNFNILSEVFDGVITVRKRGIVHQWHSPWDQIIHWYGIERMYVDMMERPELVHRVVKNFTDALAQVLDEQERLGILDVGNGNWRVGSGGMGAASKLPESVDKRKVSPKDQWGCSTAQIFSEVSPDMHEEFALQYERPILSRFGLNYYGCCEPLHKKMSLMHTIPNLRKVSASPKADLAAMAAESVNRYVLSWKADPALPAMDVFDPAQAASDARKAMRNASGVPMEIILKDLTTIRGEPGRLTGWASAVMSTVQE